MSAVVFTGRIQGQTAAGAAVGTQNPVTINGDGTLRFTDARGVPHIIPIRGSLGALLDVLFSGAGGYTTGRFDGKVPLSGPGIGGRIDS
jgi:hypothetical protein